VFGSTGSVGKQTMEVLKTHKEHFRVYGLAARDNIEELSSQIEEFRPGVVCLEKKETAKKISAFFPNVDFCFGQEGLIDLVCNNDIDIIVFSSSGTSALVPLIEAIKNKKKILIANKESIISAGQIINSYLDRYGGELIPLDSEHSALFECLKGEDVGEVKNLILTCSGGPFWKHSKEELVKVKNEEASRHPVWDMGSKITVDSSTLMNKGLEVIEAHYLFRLPFDKIKVVIHPECIIHSMVEFRDGSIKALLSAPDMKTPIQSALFHPVRAPRSFNDIDLTEVGKLSFFKPDMEKFPCLKLAYQAGEKGGSFPAALVFADEIIVDIFLKNKISFSEIPKMLSDVLNMDNLAPNPSMEDVLEVKRKVLDRMNERHPHVLN